LPWILLTEVGVITTRFVIHVSTFWSTFIAWYNVKVKKQSFQ